MATSSDALAIAVEHHQAGRLGKAEEIYRQILEADPDHADALHLLGVVAQEMGRPDLAVECIGRAIELNGNDSAFHSNLGNAFMAQGEVNEAVASYRRALELEPEYSEAHNNLGAAFEAQGKLNEAVISYRRAVELNPDYAEAHNNLGSVLLDLGNQSEAVASIRRALELKPDYVEAHGSLGNAFKHLRQFDDALKSYDRALELGPNHARVHFNRSILRLLLGDFEGGWPEYEWRLKTNQLKNRNLAQPSWDGTPLEKRTILVHAEQGFGDTFQFIRYAGLVKQRNPAATVIVECQRALTKLLAKCPGIDRLVPAGDELPPLDVHSSLLSLPRIFETTIESIPAHVPYVFANPALVAHWRKCLSGTSDLRVGINWQGRPGQGEFRKRDIPLECFQALAQVPGVNLIRLQKGPTREEFAEAVQHVPMIDLGDNLDEANGPFMDTAAIMMNLDLVITSDTSIPHLAGALGVPVWLALPFVPDWRWLLDRTDSLWYPTMRLFRQKSPGDWTTVSREIETALKSGHSRTQLAAHQRPR